MTLESFFITINTWMSAGSHTALLGCFLWGMVSVVFSPCHLASIPLIIAYVGGQNRILSPRQASGYAFLFTAGLSVTIGVIGVTCAILGRMLGDISSFWRIPVGAILIWTSLGMIGINAFSLSGERLQRLRIKGLKGAFILGLAYGVLSGSCTFGFIAPILAVITVQEKIATGFLMILCFALGHCLPIAAAGSSTAMVKGILGNARLQHVGLWFRKSAGVLISLMGGYFILSPFL